MFKTCRFDDTSALEPDGVENEIDLELHHETFMVWCRCATAHILINKNTGKCMLPLWN